MEQAAVSQPAMHHFLVDVNSSGRNMMNVEDTRLARVLWQGNGDRGGSEQAAGTLISPAHAQYFGMLRDARIGHRKRWRRGRRAGRRRPGRLRSRWHGRR